MKAQMAKRTIQFIDEQMKILLKNPNVEEVSSNTIKYTSAFKQLALELNQKVYPQSKCFKKWLLQMVEKCR